MRSCAQRAWLLVLALATLVSVEAEAPPRPGDAFASRPEPELQPELHLEACEGVGAEKLVDWCRGEPLLPGCFRVESVPDELPASCQLQGPNATGQAASLLGQGQSVVGGDLLLTGQLRLEQLRLQLTGSLTLEEASVRMSGNATSEAKQGGAFSAGSVVTIRRSNLTVAGTKAPEGGGFYAGDLVLFQSTVSIVGTAALTGSGGGFCATGGVTMEQSSMWLQHTQAADDGGGFQSERAVRLNSASLYILDSVAESSGGGFWCGALELTDSLMTVRGGKAEGSKSIGGAFFVASTDGGSSHVSIVDSRVYVEECTAGGIAGGFLAGDEVRVAGSVLKVWNARAGRRSGGFDAGSLQVSSSVIELENTTADPGKVGAFIVRGRMVVGNHSKITLSRTFAAEQAGGFSAEEGFEVVDGSMLSIHEAKTLGQCGAFRALASVRIAGASTLRVSRSTAQGGDGGGLCQTTKAGEVLVTGRSQLAISDATSGRKGGGLTVWGSLRVTDQSVVRLKRCSAADDGGGACIAGDTLVTRGSRFLVSDVVARGDGGGLISGSMRIVEGSRLELQAVSAAHGGGFYTFQFVVVAGSSTLRVSGSDAKFHGGAFLVECTLSMTKQSRLEVENARAQEHAGTFWAETVNASMGSEIIIRNGSAGRNGGCVWSHNLELSESMLEASECVAQVDGGGFYGDKVTLSRAHVRISGSALERGGGFFAQELEAWNSELWVAGLDSMAQPATAGTDAVLGSGAFVAGPLRLTNSAVRLRNLRGKSAIASRCLRLTQATLSLDAATEVGVSVQNALCSCHATHVAAGVEIRSLHLEGALVGASVSSALLSVEPCGKEILEMAHVHLRTAQAALATTKAHTRLRNITVEYLEAIHEIQLLTAPSFEAQTVQVSCPACAQGVTFASASTGLQAVSPPSLHCEDTALLNGTTARCGCAFPQQVPDDVHYGLDVEVSETGSYCMPCPSHSQARGEECEKCPLHKAWSEGTGDPCAALPVQAELWLPLLLAAAVFVLLAAAAFEVLWAPLAVVDAHTEGEGLLVTVQGPVCHLPKFFLNHIRKEVAYSFQGTGLSWLDSQKLISGKVKSLRRCKLQLPLQPEQPPYACATSKGFLRVTRGYTRMLLQFWILLFLLLLVPTVLVVARLSKNGPWHVLVTEGYFVLPLGVCAALLHFAAPRGGLASAQAADTAAGGAPGVPQRACSSFSPALFPAAEDQDHPRNQGLSMQALQHFWEHFKRFVLERNMHFVVANIVEPLTEKQQTSFVSLLRGKPVSYFVSHSWATPFQHFVQCLQRHTAFTGAFDAAYWICSFANNQWAIAKEIGTDVLDSAFAKVLRSGVLGVVMVLDQQVQPLTRVWCLFEFLLSSELQLEVVFATELGVLGDQLASPDIALQIGRKLQSLQVANCHASSEEDKQRIFHFIRSRMGSLANMDVQIRQRMSRILQQNMQNLADATETLLLEMG